jgi:hypothetical protein
MGKLNPVRGSCRQGNEDRTGTGKTQRCRDVWSVEPADLDACDGTAGKDLGKTIIFQSRRQHDRAVQFFVSREIRHDRAAPDSGRRGKLLKALGGKADAVQCVRLHALVTDPWCQSSMSMTLPS